MMKKSILFLLIIIAVILFSEHVSRGDDIKFAKKVLQLNTQLDGGILVDSDGFLWIATVAGLYRYDGYELKHIKLGSKAGLWFVSMVEDEDAVLWFGSHDKGISSFNKKNNTWTNYKHNPKDKNSLSDNSLSYSNQSLYVDKANKLWIATQNKGLNKFDKINNIWRRFRHNPNNSNSLSSDKVTAICEAKNGILWIGTMDSGLSRFDQKKLSWKHYKHDPNNESSLSDNYVQTIIEDSEGILWIGTFNGGLNKFDREKNSFSHYKHNTNDSRSIGDNNVFHILEDSANRIWVCKYYTRAKNAGISVLDKNSDTFKRYYADAKNPFSPSTNFISGIYEDRKTGIFWITNSFDSQVDIYDPKARKFKRWDYEPGYPDYLQTQGITRIYEDSQGIIWLGTLANGLIKFDRKIGKFTRYTHDINDPDSLADNMVHQILEDHDGIFWVTARNTLHIFDRKQEKVVKRYNPDSDNPHSILRTNHFRSLIIDKDNPDIFWFGSHDAGLLKFDRKKEIFYHYKHDPKNSKSLSHDTMRIIYDDGKGNIWVPTFNGLNKLNKKTGEFQHYFHNPEDNTTIFSNFLINVYGDSLGNLWIGGRGGIARFDEVSQTFKNYTQAQGFTGTIVFTMIGDNEGNLWLGSDNGRLLKFNIEKETFKLYTAKDGLQPSAFLPNVAWKTKKGEIWIGGFKGLSSFFPEKLTDLNYIPSIVLTSITQGGKYIKIDMAPEKLKEITLSWRNNYFEFQFASLSYTRPEKNQYAYILKGIDKDWYYSKYPSGRYTNLEGGTYTLMLKGSNADGVWNEQGTSIQIKVTPPPWKTWWFFTLSGGFLFLIVSGLYIQRKGHQKAKNEAKLLAREMDIAKHIQTSLLPRNPQHLDLDIAARMIPADEVGGDFYDISFDKAGNLWIGIGDVSGHGVTASIIMMMVQAAFTTFHQTIQEKDIHPSEVVIAINRVLVQNVHKRLNENHFMTLTIFKYLGRGQFSYSGAHLDLIVHRAQTNTYNIYGTSGLFMNLLPDVVDITQDEHLTLEKGDSLIIYTDGFPEAKNRQRKGISSQLLDFKRFVDIIKKHIHKDVETAKEDIIKDTLSWCSNIRDDDMTLIVIRKK